MEGVEYGTREFRGRVMKKAVWVRGGKTKDGDGRGFQSVTEGGRRQSPRARYLRYKSERK